MLSPTFIVCLAAFVGVAALVGAVAVLMRGVTGNVVEDRLDVLTGTGPAALKKKGRSQATVIAKPLDDVPGAVEEIITRFLNLRLLLEQANWSLSPVRFVAICGALAAVGLIIPPIAGAPVALAPVSALVMGLMPLLAVLFVRRRRKKAFAKQLPEALELVARALRAGHSLASGFHLVASEMPEPIGSEFGRCYEEQNLGIPLEQALDNLANRVPNLDLRFFATAVILQRQTGGDLAEILDKIGNLIRERFKIWGAVQALTGEGRLSGIVLLALPPVLFAVMYKLNRDYVMILFEDDLGKKMLVFAVIMQLIGALVIRKIVNIRV